jgi:hypothetical protein
MTISSISLTLCNHPSANRKQVLAVKGLSTEDFLKKFGDEAEEKANEAADALIKQFQERYPEKRADHPDKLYPDFPQLDEFWFAEYKGTVASALFISVICMDPT